MVMPYLSLRSPARLCHDAVYYIVTQNREWAVAHPAASDHIFFFTHIFFFISATGKPPNIYIYIYISFSSKPNKFIKIYFIYFSSSFTHCKTLEKFLLIIFFFASPVAPLLLHNCSSLDHYTSYNLKNKNLS